MAIVERRTLKLAGTRETFEAWEQKWIAIEAKSGGFPPKRYSSVMSGRDPQGSVVWERDWESLAAIEAGFKGYANPEARKLGATSKSIVKEEIMEILWPFSIN
ncbi:MAG: hypothetical protein EXR45_05880 [Chloroflexi bacterium]|nr:hypothetical protein [Chloroflexota bacterium]